MTGWTFRRRAFLWLLLALCAALLVLIASDRPQPSFDEYSPDNVTLYESEG